MKKLFAVLMVAGSLFACQDDEAPMSAIFTIEIGEGYLPQPADNWILVSNTDGQLLDYQSLQTGTIILQASEVPDDQKLNISLLSRGTSNPNINFFSMVTYTGIDAGESWSLQRPQINADPVIGSANVKIINLPAVETVNVTFSKEFEGRVVTQGDLSNNGDYWEADLVVPLSQSQTDILISVNPLYLDPSIPPDFESKYYWLSQLTDGQQIDLDFEIDFLSYQEQFSLDIPDQAGDVILDISGFQDLDATYGAGFVFTSSLAIYPINQIEVFFNQGFNVYETSFTLSNGSGSTDYHKVGEAPSLEDLSSRDLDFQILDASFHNYAFNASPEFQVVENGWFNQMVDNGLVNSLSWQVYSEVDEVNFPVLLNFPEELVAENPVLSTDNLDNTYNRFIFNIDGQSYQDFLDKVIRQPSATKRLEEVYQLTKF